MSKKSKSIVRSGLLLTLMTFASRIMGLVREITKYICFFNILFVPLPVDMRYSTNTQGEYDHYQVTEEQPLLEFLLANVKQTKNKVKLTLQGQGVKVNGKTVTQFDYLLQPGMKVAFSKTKRNQQPFRSRYVRIVYEDRWLIIIEKQPGILSMAGGHSSLNVKTVLDDYFKKSRQKCTAHVVHRLDRDTSGLMVYAKDMETEQVLEHNWHQIVYDRRYVAVLAGVVFWINGHVLAFILPFLYLLLHVLTWQKMKRINHGRQLNECLGETARNMLVYGLCVAIGLLLI